MCTGDAGPEQSLVLVSLLEDSKDPAAFCQCTALRNFSLKIANSLHADVVIC